MSIVRYETNKIPGVFRCSCGADLDNEDNLIEHIANANEEERRIEKQKEARQKEWQQIKEGSYQPTARSSQRTESPSGATESAAGTGGRPHGASASAVPPRSQAANRPGTRRTAREQANKEMIEAHLAVAEALVKPGADIADIRQAVTSLAQAIRMTM